MEGVEKGTEEGGCDGGLKEAWMERAPKDLERFVEGIAKDSKELDGVEKGMRESSRGWTPRKGRGGHHGRGFKGRGRVLEA